MRGRRRHGAVLRRNDGGGAAAAEMLAENGVEVAVVNARFAKPIDREMVREAFASGSPVLTVEDHCVAGGFGSAVLEAAQELGLSGSRVLRLGIPDDRFIAHGSRSGQLAECGIDATGIAAAVQSVVEHGRAMPARDILRPRTVVDARATSRVRP